MMENSDVYQEFGGLESFQMDSSGSYLAKQV
jgi:hypothetical protein